MNSSFSFDNCVIFQLQVILEKCLKRGINVFKFLYIEVGNYCTFRIEVFSSAVQITNNRKREHVFGFKL